jgi:hypothetical protein
MGEEVEQSLRDQRIAAWKAWHHQRTTDNIISAVINDIPCKIMIDGDKEHEVGFAGDQMIDTVTLELKPKFEVPYRRAFVFAPESDEIATIIYEHVQSVPKLLCRALYWALFVRPSDVK